MLFGNRVVLAGFFSWILWYAETELSVGYRVLPQEVVRYGSKRNVHLSVVISHMRRRIALI